RCTTGGGGGGGGGSELTSAATVEHDHSASAATVTLGEVSMTSSSLVMAVRFAMGAGPRFAATSTPPAATLADAVSVSTMPEEAAATTARRPAGPVSAEPMPVSGVTARLSARCLASEERDT